MTFGWTALSAPGTFRRPRLLSQKSSGCDALWLEEPDLEPDGRFNLGNAQPVVVGETPQRLPCGEPREHVLGSDPGPSEHRGPERTPGVDHDDAFARHGPRPPPTREAIPAPLHLAQIAHHRVWEHLLAAPGHVDEVRLAISRPLLGLP